MAALRVPRLLTEAFAVLRAARPRPSDLPALASLLRYSTTFAGAGLVAARRSPSAPVLVDHLGPLDGAGLVRAVDGMVPALARHGGRDGAGRVLVCAGDHRGLVVATLAAGVLGATATLVSPAAGIESLRASARRARPDVVVHDATTADLVAAAGLAGPRLDALTVRPRPAGRRAARWPRPARPGRLLLLTSGTTGPARATARGRVGPHAAVTAVSLLAALGLRRGEPVLIAPPLAHGHGLSALAAAFLVGAPAVLASRGPANGGVDLAALAREHRVGALVAVPAQLARFLDAAGDVREDFPVLRRIATGSAPLPSGLAARTEECFGDVLVDFFGTSETGTATVATAVDLREAPGSVGRPVNGVRIEIVDDDGARVTPGTEGRVVVRSPWRAGDEGAGRVLEGGQGLAGGRLLTGDRGYLDAAGRLFLAGRADDVVVVGGHNVRIGVVRRWLLDQPEVSSAVVRAVPHDSLGEVLVAEVAGGHCDPESLRQRARMALGRAAAPRVVRVVRREADGLE
ncbi:AMP-binding protein [Georgenia alba]|uniref:AMP-binding protein n=1 Tax=Georgenia alba TaxID=2233858 RepID=A0ABW2Q8L1_9MICO